MTEDLYHIRERLAVLEQAVIDSKDDRAILHTKIANTNAKLDTVKETTNTILRKIERYEGKFGGILLTVGAVVSFFTIFFKTILSNWEHFVDWLKG